MTDNNEIQRIKESLELFKDYNKAFKWIVIGYVILNSMAFLLFVTLTVAKAFNL